MSLARRLWILRIMGAAAFAAALFFTGAWAIEDYLVPGRIPSPGASIGTIGAADVIELTNRERARKGLPPLATNTLLSRAAQLKAEDMARNEYYAHVGPDGRGPLSWLSEVEYRYLNAGENLVIDRTTPEAAVDAWMGSADHRANILRPQFTEIGVGVAQGRYKGTATVFVVQVFGTPLPTRPVVTPRTSSESSAVVVPARSAPQIEPSSLPRLSAPAATATSTVPASVDPLVGRVQRIVEPVTAALTPSTPSTARPEAGAGESTPLQSQSAIGRTAPRASSPVSTASSSLSAVAGAAPVAAMPVFSVPVFNEPISVEPVQLVLRAAERGTEASRAAETEGWQAQASRVINRALTPIRTFFSQVPTYWP